MKIINFIDKQKNKFLVFCIALYSLSSVSLGGILVYINFKNIASNNIKPKLYITEMILSNRQEENLYNKMPLINTGFENDESLYAPQYPPNVINNPRTVIPVLMYHHIADAPQSFTNYQKSFYVTADSFEKQMQYLKENGYEAVTIDRYIELLNAPSNLGYKYVLITFDDGNLDNYTNAYPVLKKYKFPAVFFICSGKLAIKPNELKEMSDNGMIIGSHTVTHPNLTKLDYNSQASEIRNSKNRLQDITGKPVEVLAYPGCTANGTTMGLLSKYGYKLGFTCAWPHGILNTPTDTKRISRIHVDNGLDSLKKALAGN